MRILLDPDPPAQGGAPAPTPTPIPTPTQAVVVPPTISGATPAPPTPPAPPVMIQITAEHHRQLIEDSREQSRIRAEAEEKVRVAERKAAEAIGEKDGAKAAVAKMAEDFDRERSGYRSQIHQSKAESALNAALAGIDFADAVALEQARAILAPRIVVEKDQAGNNVALDSASRRPAAEVIRELAAGPEFARFRKAPHQGGGGGGNGPPSTPPGGAPAQEDWVEQLTARMRATQPAHGNSLGKPLAGFPGN